jgi:hypothetical protein
MINFWEMKWLKKTVQYIIVLIVNFILFYVLQIIGVFVQFFLFGEGETSDRHSKLLFFIFLLIQSGILYLLYWLKKIIPDLLLLLLNMILIIFLYLYTVVDVSQF